MTHLLEYTPQDITTRSKVTMQLIKNDITLTYMTIVIDIIK